MIKMLFNNFVSKSEHKLLLGLFLTIFCLFYTHLSVSEIEFYNDTVKEEQTEKQHIADTLPNERISFSNCVFAPPFHTQLFWIQLFTNPLILLLLWKPKVSLFAVSFVLNLVTTLSLLSWNHRNYFSYLLGENFWLKDSQFGYFGLLSHLTAFFLAVLSSIFVILQICILIRFTIEKFQAKLFLK
jgi:hypothetical protein